MKNIFQKALTVTGMVVAAQVSYAQAWDPNLNTTDHTRRIGSVSVGTPFSVAGVKFLVSVNGLNPGVIGIVSDGTFGIVPTTPGTNTRWNALGDRTPISSVAGFQTTGLRTQWDNYGLNIGVVNKQTANNSGGKDALIAWQDATFTSDPTTISPFSTLAGLRFVFRNGLAPAPTGTALEVMRMLPNGNIGIGISTPVAKLQVENGIIGQSSIPNTFGIPSGRWSAIGTNGGPSAVGFPSSVSGFTYTWNNRAFYAGLFESAGQRDGLIAWQDFSATSIAGNRLRIGSVVGNGSVAIFTEHATVLSNGNVGIGTQTPNSRLTISNGNVSVSGGTIFGDNSAFPGVKSLVVTGRSFLLNPSVSGIPVDVATFNLNSFGSQVGGTGDRGIVVNVSVTGNSKSVYGADVDVNGENVSGGFGLTGIRSRIKANAFSIAIDGSITSTIAGTQSIGVRGAVPNGSSAINTVTGAGPTVYAINGVAGGNNSWAGYFQGSVFSTRSISASDMKLKENIKNMVLTEDVMMGLTPKTFTFKKDMQTQMSLPSEKQMGFMAQDMEKYFPELVTPVTQPEERNDKGEVTKAAINFKGINYQGLIALLWSGMQKQQKTITQMQKEMEKMQTKKELAARQGLAVDSTDANELYQNTPNPFGQNTVIAYKIISTASKASIQIFDMTGKTIKKIEVLPSSSQITLEANGLTAGMYMYALVIDSKLVDTKRMILE